MTSQLPSPPAPVALRVLLLALLSTSPDLAADTPHPATHHAIGLSPFLERPVKDALFRRIIEFVLEDLPLGSTLGLYDAYHLQTITHIDVPAARAFESGKTRANQFAPAFGKLRQFLAAEHPAPAAPRTKLSQAVRFPQFMDFVSTSRGHPDQSLSIIIIGSPLYTDFKEPAFSMADGCVPSDGHLLASRDRTVYGIQGRAHALDNVLVDWVFFGDPWLSEIHRERVTRFWKLHVHGQGGRLASLGGDLATAFRAAQAPPAAGPSTVDEPHPDPTQSKLEMIRVTREVRVTDWITRDGIDNASSGPPSTLEGPMKIGIRWTGDLDLDLYATPRPDAQTLCFEQTRTPEGYYYKDHRSSPLREFEFIEFESPVNVRQVDARVNFHTGRAASGADGQVRIEFDGRIFSGRFEIPANNGNEGRSGPDQARFWTQINIPKILMLDGGSPGPGAFRRE